MLELPSLLCTTPSPSQTKTQGPQNDQRCSSSLTPNTVFFQFSPQPSAIRVAIGDLVSFPPYGPPVRYAAHFATSFISLDSLSLDEIIELIIYELDDPTALTLTSKRFLRVSQDPYVRAHYFLTRYGHMDAMFWALGRGKLLNEKVIDVRFSHTRMLF